MWFQPTFFQVSQLIWTTLLFFSIFLKNFWQFFKNLFLERGEGREEEKERNSNVWLPLTCPPLGTWPTTQACAPTGNRTGDPLVPRPALNPLSHTSQGEGHLFQIIISYVVISNSLFFLSSSWLFFSLFCYLHVIKYTYFKCKFYQSYTCKHHSNQDRNCHHPRRLSHAPSQWVSTPTLPEPKTFKFFHHRFVLLVLKFHRNGIIQYVPIYVSLLLLSLMFLKFTQVVCTKSSFLFIAVQYSVIRIFQFV